MRYELKYILTPVQYILLKNKLKWLLEPDVHAQEGQYFIRSIYLDTPDRKALREKIDGVQDREKYRIRFYNGDSAHCVLECKKKRGTRIEKVSQPLAPEQVNRLLHPQTLQGKDLGQVLEEAQGLYRQTCLLCAEGLQPVVTVDYIREPYVASFSNLRVTFDKEIAWGPVEGCLENPRALSNIYGQDIVLEVKYDEYLPEHISRVLSSVPMVPTAASKYVACAQTQFYAVGY